MSLGKHWRDNFSLRFSLKFFIKFHENIPQETFRYRLTKDSTRKNATSEYFCRLATFPQRHMSLGKNALGKGAFVVAVLIKEKGIKRSAGGDIAPTTRHYRRVSIDSAMGKLNFMEESLKLPPSLGGQMGKIVSGDSVDPNVDTFNLEFGNGMFNGAELKKIMVNENLAEMALTDPKSVK
ncbi:hypothetical protein Tco_0658465, partial [Tanacetum coccineum]